MTVDPEILLVDEVLAVGDAAFPRKGVNRMNHCKKVGGKDHGAGDPLKVVFSAEGSRIVVITAYPLRKERES